jgi:hypothetical protein
MNYGGVIVHSHKQIVATAAMLGVDVSVWVRGCGQSWAWKIVYTGRTMPRIA